MPEQKQRDDGETERVKIGPRITQRVWDEFKEYVQQKHGKTHGVTSQEVEKALKKHMGGTEMHEIEERLERIEAKQDSALVSIHSQQEPVEVDVPSAEVEQR